MYQVSQDFFDQTKTPIQKCYLRGTIEDNITFTEDHIVKETYSIQAQSTDATSVKIGTVYTKTLKFTLFHGVTNLRGQWQGKKIKIEQGQVVNGRIEWCLMGTFFVAEGVWTPKGINIVAYDNMMKFDKEIDFTQTSGQAYDLLSAACQYCEVELGMTRAQVEALPNGTDTLGVSEDANILYYRDYIGYIATALGGFAEIYRDGKLYIRNYHQTIDDTITNIERFKNPSFSDFTSYFGQVSIIDSDTGEEEVYDTGNEGGLKLELGNNPLLQLGLEEVVQAQRQAVADAVAYIDYTPFSFTVLSSPYYDLSDVILCTGGIADNYKCCVMAITYGFSKIKLTGYGENPALQNTKSATSKAIARGGGGKDPIIYHTFINSGRINLSTSWQKVAQLGFTVNTQTITEIWHEFILDLDQASDVQVRYVYDGNVIPYNPETIFSESGKHLLGTQMWVNALGQQAHRWEVFLKLDSGTGSIAVGDVHALLKGQGLAGGEGLWDGTFDLNDTFDVFNHEAQLPTLTETISLDTNYPEPIVLAETYSAFLHEAVLPTLTEEFNLISFIPHNYLVTENGDNLITENNEDIIT